MFERQGQEEGSGNDPGWAASSSDETLLNLCRNFYCDRLILCRSSSSGAGRSCPVQQPGLPTMRASIRVTLKLIGVAALIPLLFPQSIALCGMSCFGRPPAPQIASHSHACCGSQHSQQSKAPETSPTGACLKHTSSFTCCYVRNAIPPGLRALIESGFNPSHLPVLEMPLVPFLYAAFDLSSPMTPGGLSPPDQASPPFAAPLRI